MTMTLCGYPQDYDIVGDPQDNEVNGVPFWLSHFERPSYYGFQGYADDYNTLGARSWLWHYAGHQGQWHWWGYPFHRGTP